MEGNDDITEVVAEEVGIKVSNRVLGGEAEVGTIGTDLAFSFELRC